MRFPSPDVLMRSFAGRGQGAAQATFQKGGQGRIEIFVALAQDFFIKGQAGQSVKINDVIGTGGKQVCGVFLEPDHLGSHGQIAGNQLGMACSLACNGKLDISGDTGIEAAHVLAADLGIILQE